jgi:hypothetical protein
MRVGLNQPAGPDQTWGLDGTVERYQHARRMGQTSQSLQLRILSPREPLTIA